MALKKPLGILRLIATVRKRAPGGDHSSVRCKAEFVIPVLAIISRNIFIRISTQRTISHFTAAHRSSFSTAIVFPV